MFGPCLSIPPAQSTGVGRVWVPPCRGWRAGRRWQALRGRRRRKAQASRRLMTATSIAVMVTSQLRLRRKWRGGAATCIPDHPMDPLEGPTTRPPMEPCRQQCGWQNHGPQEAQHDDRLRPQHSEEPGSEQANQKPEHGDCPEQHPSHSREALSHPMAICHFPRRPSGAKPSGTI